MPIEHILRYKPVELDIIPISDYEASYYCWRLTATALGNGELKGQKVSNISPMWAAYSPERAIYIFYRPKDPSICLQIEHPTEVTQVQNLWQEFNKLLEATKG